MPEIPLKKIIAECDRLFNAGDQPAVGEHLRYYLEEAEKIGDLSGKLSILNELIGHYRMNGAEAPALAAVKESLKLMDELRVRQSSGAGTILCNAATALQAFGDAAGAMPLYHEAYCCYVHAGLPENDQLFAGLFNNMASAFAALGDLDSAEAYYLAAADILEKARLLMDAAVAYVNLARLRRDSAEKFLASAMAFFDSPEVERNGYYAHTALKCAGAFDELGFPETGAELRSRAGNIYRGEK